jgi:2-amino-4-hydroxy-6-hydroxymethyldihydropteridine diphosphokinase
MTRYALGLGSNLGDRLANLRRAYTGLEGLGRVTAVSGLYETTPIGGPEQDPYLNAVVVLELEMEPLELLAVTQSIEHEAGRVRGERWGPRTLDVDILTSDGTAVAEDTLELPHPRAADREFVLRPLAEAWPDASLGDGVVAGDALRRLDPQGVDLLARRWVTDSMVGTWLVIAQVVLLGAVGVGIVGDGSVAFADRPLQTVVGVGLVIGGGALGWAGVRALGPALTAKPEPRPGVGMVEHGPYRLVRHPIYGSVFLIVAGVAVALASRLGMAGAVVLLIFLLFKARYEERRLRIRYPGYGRYRDRVRRWMVPGVF